MFQFYPAQFLRIILVKRITGTRIHSVILISWQVPDLTNLNRILRRNWKKENPKIEIAYDTDTIFKVLSLIYYSVIGEGGYCYDDGCEEVCVPH